MSAEIVHLRVYVLSHSIEPDNTHVCMLTYKDEVQDDERELWRGIGIDFESACNAVWRAYFKWQKSCE